MTNRLSLPMQKLFWPPTDTLTKATKQIRVSLGNWPSKHVPWRICLIAPTEPNSSDLIIISGSGSNYNEPISRWLLYGAGVIQVTERRATLYLGTTQRYELEGHVSKDWIVAFAAFLDCGFSPCDALILALAWRDGDEQATVDAWPIDLSRFPRVVGLPTAPTQPFALCFAHLGFYPILPTANWVKRVLSYGAKTVQLRLKLAQPKKEVVKKEITRCVAAGHTHNAQVFINDHWREAIEAGAYGVHLGQEDIRIANLHTIAAAGLRLGLSTHSYYEILTALHFRPSYVALGTIFPTTTKVISTAPQGLIRLARYVQLLDGVVPLVAIGGINANVLPKVLATGVSSVALVRTVTEAINPAKTVAALLHSFTQ